MKRLTSARFYRVDKDEERLFVIGPVTQKRESFYLFNDSIRPHRVASFPLKEGEEMTQKQTREPVLVYEQHPERVYWFQHRFLLCTTSEEDPSAVRAWVLQNEDRQAKRAPKRSEAREPS